MQRHFNAYIYSMNPQGLPTASIETRISGTETQVFDIFRNKWVLLTPEENVRQHLLHYLVNHLGYKKGLISVEKQITVHQLSRRYDAVCYTQAGVPSMLIECKAPNVPITNDTFLQIAQYNIQLKVPYLLVSNGITHYICKAFFEKGSIDFLTEIPPFTT